MRLAWAVVAGTVAVAGCADGASDYTYEDDDFPAGGCRDTDRVSDTECDTDDPPTTTANTTGTDASCSVSGDCMGGVCVAIWDEGQFERGAFECRFACVPTLDETVWCSDDASCCDREATCTARGYCVVDVDPGGGTTTTTTTGDDGTSSSSSSSSSSGSSSSSSATDGSATDGSTTGGTGSTTGGTM